MSNLEIEAKSVYNQEVPEDTQRESAMEDRALGVVFFKITREAKRKLTRNPKASQKSLINGHGRSL